MFPVTSNLGTIMQHMHKIVRSLKYEWDINLKMVKWFMYVKYTLANQ